MRAHHTRLAPVTLYWLWPTLDLLAALVPLTCCSWLDAHIVPGTCTVLTGVTLLLTLITWLIHTYLTHSHSHRVPWLVVLTSPTLTLYLYLLVRRTDWHRFWLFVLRWTVTCTNLYLTTLTDLVTFIILTCTIYLPMLWSPGVLFLDLSRISLVLVSARLAHRILLVVVKCTCIELLADTGYLDFAYPRLVLDLTCTTLADLLTRILESIGRTRGYVVVHCDWCFSSGLTCLVLGGLTVWPVFLSCAVFGCHKLASNITLLRWMWFSWYQLFSAPFNMSVSTNWADLHSAGVGYACWAAGTGRRGYQHTDLHCELWYIVLTGSAP